MVQKKFFSLCVTMSTRGDTEELIISNLMT